jgi:ribonuclease I
MNWKPHLPEIFLLISLGMIAIEAALSRIAPIKARYRHCARPLFSIFALLAFVFSSAISSASARHCSQASEGARGDFAYYLLSLSWSPAFCLSSPGAAECNGPRRYGFIVHGLWPHADAAKGIRYSQ